MNAPRTALTVHHDGRHDAASAKSAGTPAGFSRSSRPAHLQRAGHGRLGSGGRGHGVTESEGGEAAPARRSLRDFTGEEVWADLLERSFERRHPAGTVLLRQGEPGTHVLAVVTGVAKVIRRERSGDLSLLAFRGPGELLGEVAVLDDGVRSANVESISPCVVGVLGKADFLSFVGDRGLFPTLVRYALTRLRESDEARGGGDIRVRLAAALVYLIDISAQPSIPLGAGALWSSRSPGTSWHSTWGSPGTRSPPHCAPWRHAVCARTAGGSSSTTCWLCDSPPTGRRRANAPACVACVTPLLHAASTRSPPSRQARAVHDERRPMRGDPVPRTDQPYARSRSLPPTAASWPSTPRTSPGTRPFSTGRSAG